MTGLPQLVYSSDLDTSPPEELVKGMIPRGPAVGIAFGPPHCGKSFTFSTELPLCVANSRPFLGRDVIGGTTVLALGEGLLGAGVRKAAKIRWQAEQDAAAGLEPGGFSGDKFLILTESWPLAITRDGNLNGTAEQVIGQLSCIADLELLCLDSLADFVKGAALSNESSCTRIMEGAKTLAARLGCVVLLVHHTTKKGDAMLGSDRLRAAADFVISVEPEQGGRDSSLITCEKQRYAERFAPFAVEAVPYAWDEPARDPETDEPTGGTFRAASFITRLRTDAGDPWSRPGSRRRRSLGPAGGTACVPACTWSPARGSRTRQRPAGR